MGKVAEVEWAKLMAKELNEHLHAEWRGITSGNDVNVHSAPIDVMPVPSPDGILITGKYVIRDLDELERQIKIARRMATEHYLDQQHTKNRVAA